MATDSPIASLEREHRVLSGVMGALERWADGLLRTGDGNREDLDRLVRVVADLADIAHHEKEEDILLPLLYKHGFEWDSGPLRRVRDEHAQERYLTRVIAQAATQEGDWTEEDRRHLIASIEAYVAFQRKHMTREDEALYPAVDTLPEAARADLQKRLTQFEVDFGKERYDALIRDAEALAEKYDAEQSLAGTASG